MTTTLTDGQYIGTEGETNKSVSRRPRDHHGSVALGDRVRLMLCALGLVCYLLYSEAVRHFGREIVRLVAKL